MTVENVMYSPTTRYKQNITNRVNERGEQSPVSWTRHACNSAPNEPNDFKFCIHGTFMGYNWVLVTSRSCDLYRDWTCSGLQIWLASIEVTWPWLDQNSIVTHKSPLHLVHEGWVTGAPLSRIPDFAPPPFHTFSVTSTGKLNNSRHLDWWKSWILVRMKAETVSMFISFMMVMSKSCDIQDVLWSRSTSNWTTATTFSWVNSPSSDAKSYAPHEDNTCTYT